MKQLLFTLIAFISFTSFGSEQPGKKISSPHYLRYVYGFWVRNRPEIIQASLIIGGFAVARNQKITSEQDLNTRLAQRMSGIAIGTGIALADNYLIHSRNDDKKRLSEHRNVPAELTLNCDQNRSLSSALILNVALLSAVGSGYLRHLEI